MKNKEMATHDKHQCPGPEHFSKWSPGAVSFEEHLSTGVEGPQVQGGRTSMRGCGMMMVGT